MLWKIKKLDKPIFTFSLYQFTPKAVRLIKSDQPLIGSALKDSTINLNQKRLVFIKFRIRLRICFMESQNSSFLNNSHKDKIIVCADIKQ